MAKPETELQKNAIATARRQELESFQRALDIQWLNSRMEDGGIGRCLALIKREAEMEKDFQERTDHAAIVNAKAEKETKLGIEIAKVQHEEACKLLRRHYLWERDPSLRQLIKKLQAGYVNRDLQQQILHNEYRRLQDKAEENRANEVLREALYNDAELQYIEEKEKMERNMQYCAEIQQQLVIKHQQKQCQYEDTLIERKMLEDIMRTIADEDQRELQQKREQMEKCRWEMETSLAARMARREKQKQLLLQEKKELDKQQQHAGDRSNAVVAAREKKMRQREEINQRIAAKIMADQAKREERNNLIKLLQEQELLEKNVQDDGAGRDKLERVKNETKTALTDQMETKKRMADQQREMEAMFREQAEAKIAAEDAKEREKQMKLKEKRQQYSRELRQQIEDNARRRKMDQTREENRAKHVWDCDKAWQAEVSEERRKIIEQHAPHVLGYLQTGVLTRADLPHVRGAGQLEKQTLSGSQGTKTRPKCNAQCRILREF